MTTGRSSSPFTMVGSPDALVCEDGACLVPGTQIDIEPETDGAATESA